MIYRVEETEDVLADLAVLGAEALIAYLELKTALELARGVEISTTQTTPRVPTCGHRCSALGTVSRFT